MKNQTFDDIIFENRNQEFGAYYLRIHYAEHLSKALFYSIIIVIIFVFAAFKYVNRPKLALLPIDPPKWVFFEPITIKPEKVKIKKQIKVKVTTSIFIEPNPIPVITEPELKIASKDDLEHSAIGTLKVDGSEENTGTIGQDNGNAGNSIDIPNTIEEPEKEIISNEPLLIADVNPEYIGGTSAMMAYLAKNIKYPNAAIRAGVSGRVFVRFVVEKDGSITQVMVLKGINFGCDEEAKRVVKSMPLWKPGSVGGKKVRVFFTMPIYFKLD